jgi:hypothetical protein
VDQLRLFVDDQASQFLEGSWELILSSQIKPNDAAGQVLETTAKRLTPIDSAHNGLESPPIQSTSKFQQAALGPTHLQRVDDKQNLKHDAMSERSRNNFLV